MRPMGCSTVSRNDDGEFRRGTAQRQKNFGCFCCVFRSQKQITYETPIRGVLTTSSESPKVGQTHSRLPTRLKTGRKENFCDAQPPHAATFTRREEELQAPVAEFFRLEADSPYGKLQKCLGEALLRERIFFSLFL